MPINPLIALGQSNGVPPISNPVRTLGALAQMRDAQGLAQARDLENEKRRRELQDEDAITRTIQSTGGDHDAAIESLYRQGRVSAAHSVATQVYDWRSKQADAVEKDLKARSTRAAMATQIGQTVHDQSSYEAALPALKQIVPDMAEGLPAQYEPKSFQQMVDMGTTHVEYMKQQQDAIKNAHDAIELGRQLNGDIDKRAEVYQKQDEAWTKAAGGLLSLAGSQDQWAANLNMLRMGGAPVATLAKFGSQFSPEAKQRALQLGQTPAERQASEDRQTGIGISEGNLELRQKEFNERAGKGSPQTAIAQRSATTAKLNEYKALEKEQRDTSIGIPRLTKAQENDPDYKDAKQAADDRDAEYAQRKLEIENRYRERVGLPSLEETEHQLTLANDPAKAADLKKVRSVYKALTGKDTLLSQMETLTAKAKAEKDPTKFKALQDQLRAVRTQYDQQQGR